MQLVSILIKLLKTIIQINEIKTHNDTILCFDLIVESEQLQFHDEAAKDLFLLGYILSFCIHGGRYLLSDPPERYIANCSPPEAVDLISQLISRYAIMR